MKQALCAPSCCPSYVLLRDAAEQPQVGDLNACASQLDHGFTMTDADFYSSNWAKWIRRMLSMGSTDSPRSVRFVARRLPLVYSPSGSSFAARLPEERFGALALLRLRKGLVRCVFGRKHPKCRLAFDVGWEGTGARVGKQYFVRAALCYCMLGISTLGMLKARSSWLIHHSSIPRSFRLPSKSSTRSSCRSQGKS